MTTPVAQMRSTLLDVIELLNQVLNTNLASDPITDVDSARVRLLLAGHKIDSVIWAIARSTSGP
jgi:hypothetical protein